MGGVCVCSQGDPPHLFVFFSFKSWLKEKSKVASDGEMSYIHQYSLLLFFFHFYMLFLRYVCQLLRCRVVIAGCMFQRLFALFYALPLKNRFVEIIKIRCQFKKASSWWCCGNGLFCAAN
ncbi:hypothetical protein EDD21DRAFT_361743 [Dissophora ornata]|nr:hypothetical protein EDD21DRAFT_361743 [Dissophora ornata]